MAATAVDVLLDQMGKPDQQPIKAVLATRLVVRGSTSPLNRQA
jgi:DNA-binding LacI/PurR family transcriptional regulator